MLNTHAKDSHYIEECSVYNDVMADKLIAAIAATICGAIAILSFTALIYGCKYRNMRSHYYTSLAQR